MHSESILSRCLVVIFPLVLVACDRGGSAPVPTMTLSGTVTYTSYKPISPGGLNYSSPAEKPIRGAVIEIQNTAGAVFSFGNTSATGSYSLTAPQNSAVRVVVKAALGSKNAPNTQVVDNTSGGALYALTQNVTTGSSDMTQSFNAASGWGGSSYTGTRAAAPFAILDVIYSAQQMVLAADSSASFPALEVNWSINNVPTSGAVSAGQIGTSYYSAGKLYILGAANNDTDEYDTHVIAHEWGHYFEDKFSRTDSIGGSHSGGDTLDPTVAFGEGFGNAVSGMVMQDPVYVDTGGTSQGTAIVTNKLDTDTGNEGYYSEDAVQEVLYDLYDSGGSDDDSLALGFTPIYNVLVNSEKTTPAFTSIFSFLHYLKQTNASSSSAIASLAAAESIAAGDEYESSGLKLYTTVPFDGSVISTGSNGSTLVTSTVNGSMTASNPGNKLHNRLFFKYAATASGCYTIKATPVAPTPSGDVILYGIKGVRVDNYYGGGAETYAKNYTSGENGSFAVGSFTGATYFTVQIYSSSGGC